MDLPSTPAGNDNGDESSSSPLPVEIYPANPLAWVKLQQATGQANGANHGSGNHNDPLKDHSPKSGTAYLHAATVDDHLPAKNDSDELIKTITSEEAKTTQTEAKKSAKAAAPIFIISQNFARAAKIFDLHVVHHLEPEEIAVRFDMSVKSVIFTINNFYAYKLRHDPALKRHCRDQIRTSLQMLMNHFLPYALAGGNSEARKNAEIVVKVAGALTDMYGLKTSTPAEKEQQINNTQINYNLDSRNGRGIMQDPAEMIEEIRGRLMGV